MSDEQIPERTDQPEGPVKSAPDGGTDTDRREQASTEQAAAEQAGGEQAVGDAGDRGAVLGEPAGPAHTREQDRGVPLAARELDRGLESPALRLVDVAEVVQAGASLIEHGDRCGIRVIPYHR